eukprot:149885-Pleurochrysis_carterae.AAC.1
MKTRPAARVEEDDGRLGFSVNRGTNVGGTDASPHGVGSEYASKRTAEGWWRHQQVGFLM